MTLPTADRFWTAWRRRKWRGFHRAWSWRLRRGHRTELLVRSSYGPVFALDPFAYIDGFVIERGFYESEVLDALRPALAPGTVLWDIGGNIGLHAITAKLLHPTATVCAFEPVPAVMTRLQRNAALNQADIRLFNLALSDREGVATMHLGQPGNYGMSTLCPWNGANYAGTCHVATARGDQLVETGVAPAPAVIKLDVEGHEAAVLRGLARVLARPECRLMIFEDGVAADTEAKRLLAAAGFQIRILARQEATEHALANFVAEKLPAAAR